jgi:hypothetical protein
VQSDEGDELQLLPQPTDLPAPRWPPRPAAVGGGAGWAATGSTTPSLRESTDAVLLLARAGESLPAWLETLGRPVVVLVDSPEAEPPRLSLQARHQGWLAEGRLLQALEAALPGDPRLPRLRRAWTQQQQQSLQAGVQVVADTLGEIAASTSRRRRGPAGAPRRSTGRTRGP